MKKKNPILLYLVWTFGVSYGFELLIIFLDKLNILTSFYAIFYFLMTFAVFGPGIGAYKAMKSENPGLNIRIFFKSILHQKSTTRTVCIVISAMLLMLGINFLFVDRSMEKWYMFFLYIPFMIMGGGLEEIGWRGYLHPLLQKKLGFGSSIPIIGLIWACWHIPLWFITGTSQSNENFFIFIIFCMCLSAVLGLIHNLTQSTTSCILIHAWSNVLFSMFVYNLMIFEIKTVMVVASYLMIAIVIALVTRKKSNLFLLFCNKKSRM